MDAIFMYSKNIKTFALRKICFYSVQMPKNKDQNNSEHGHFW